MALAKKYRRRIEVDGRSYLWWVYEDLEACGATVLRVASEDGAFHVEQGLDQAEDLRHMHVLGSEFPGLQYSDGSLSRLRCPRFHAAAAVKPADVRKLIAWCLDPSKAVVLVDWQGEALSPRVIASLSSQARERPLKRPLQRTAGRRVSKRGRLDRRRRVSVASTGEARRR
jgi:hypothetical protein